MNSRPTSLLDFVGNCTQLLLLGEGDFSFALQLASQLTSTAREADTPSCVIVATSFDDAATVRALYTQASANIGYLLSLGVEVLHEVDATDVAASLQRARHSGEPHGAESLLPCTFDRVIFNFPQHAERRKVQKQRELLQEMFRSGAAVLADQGQYLVTLKRGQGGTLLDNDGHAFDMLAERTSSVRPYKPRKSADSWCLQEQAAEAGFILVAVRAVPIESLQYTPKGRRGGDRPFHCDGAVMHVLEMEAVPVKGIAAFPLRYAFLIQLFCWGCLVESHPTSALASTGSEAVEKECANDASVAEAFFAAQCTQICDAGVAISFAAATEWSEHKRPRFQRKFEITVSSASRALTRSHAIRLASQIRRNCFERFVRSAPSDAVRSEVEVEMPDAVGI